MNVFLTFDYEIFFGETSGSVEKCMIEPTTHLLELAKSNNLSFTFFWDIGHYIALKRYADDFEWVKSDVDAIFNQVKQMVRDGHAVELHIHPHWEKAVLMEGKWKMNVENHYKLPDFSELERAQIFNKYKNALVEVTGNKTTVFRAGGWCIQPFSVFKELFIRHGIKIDSSVMPGIHWKSKQYNLDFTTVSTTEPYRFSDDVCVIDHTGEFVEFPIASMYYSPLFFWKLYGLGRLFPEQHKMWGDGNFISQPGGKKEMLTKGKLHHVSTDGYFASQLEKSFLKLEKKGSENMVVIGHPKSLTKFALRKIMTFTTRNLKNKRFKTLTEMS